MNRRTTTDWQQLDKQHLWHPFTQMQDWQASQPLVIDRAERFELIDTDGRRYIDGHSSLWVNIHGHGHPALVRAIAEQAAKLDHSTMLGLASTPSIELGRRLTALAPRGLSRVFYSDNGSTAVEVALKMSYQYWQHKGQNRRTFLSFSGAYHGDTIGSVAVGGIDLFHGAFRKLLFDTYQAPYPYPYRDEQHRDKPEACLRECLNRAEQILRSHAHEICAIVTEPGIQAAAGMLVAPAGFLRGVEELARRYGVQLIVDEVATGFGRTGAMFACEHEQVHPDYLCLAKGLTGGILPLAVTLTTNEVYDAFLGHYEQFKTFFHGHSFTGNPIGCAAALASLDLFESQHLIRTMQPALEAYHEALGRLREHPHVGEVRHYGWMAGIELVRDRVSREVWPLSELVPQRVVLAARQHGAVIRPLGHTMVLMPPPAIDLHTAMRLVSITAQAIDDVTLHGLSL